MSAVTVGKAALPSSALEKGSESFSEFGPDDIILGKGNGINNLPGNVKFRKIVESYRPLYVSAPRRDKATVAWKVLKHLSELNPPARFLIPVTTDRGIRYVEASKTRGHEKTCQALREKEKKRKPKVTQAEAKDNWIQVESNNTVDQSQSNLDSSFQNNDDDAMKTLPKRRTTPKATAFISKSTPRTDQRTARRVSSNDQKRPLNNQVPPPLGLLSLERLCEIATSGIVSDDGSEGDTGDVNNIMDDLRMETAQILAMMGRGDYDK